MKTIGHFVDGKRVAGTSDRTKDIYNPNIGEVQAKVSMATPSELDAAVASAAEAQVKWANTNPQKRSRILFAYKQLVDANMDDLAAMLSFEHGKVIADSRGDVMRGVLVDQVTGRVRWRSSIEWVVAQGVSEFWEIGAGKALSGMIRRIHREAGTRSIGTPADVVAAKEA